MMVRKGFSQHYLLGLGRIPASSLHVKVLWPANNEGSSGILLADIFQKGGIQRLLDKGKQLEWL